MPKRPTVRISSEGYPRVYAGRSHPLADKSGYVYIHRLVMASAGEEIAGKIVHHQNEIKTSCMVRNLHTETRSEHSSRHAKKARRDKSGRFAGKRRRA